MRPRVNFQIRHLNELLAAIAARVVLQFIEVRLDVNLQIVFGLEELLANRAHELVELAVRLQMYVEMGLRREGFLADVAFEVFQSQVAVLVIDEVLLALEGFRAERARKDFLLRVRVDALVGDEVAAQHELLLADFAGELVVAGVLRGVFLQPDFGLEGFAASVEAAHELRVVLRVRLHVNSQLVVGAEEFVAHRADLWVGLVSLVLDELLDLLVDRVVHVVPVTRRRLARLVEIVVREAVVVVLRESIEVFALGRHHCWLGVLVDCSCVLDVTTFGLDRLWSYLRRLNQDRRRRWRHRADVRLVDRLVNVVVVRHAHQ